MYTIIMGITFQYHASGGEFKNIISYVDDNSVRLESIVFWTQ